jgi:hypothetical protein
MSDLKIDLKFLLIGIGSIIIGSLLLMISNDSIRISLGLLIIPLILGGTAFATFSLCSLITSDK